jgi:RimJ/RimL family protein N-acetyltransferase
MQTLTQAAVAEPLVFPMPRAPRPVERFWRTGLPALGGETIVLRDLRVSDARSLHERLSRDEVARFISPPPATVEGFERFICWAHTERTAGRSACFAIIATGTDTAVGIIQVRQIAESFDIAEWGFALGSDFWGTGLFGAAAALVLEFAFDTLGVNRLEARASRLNGRGNGALRKLGAVHEGVLRRSFLRDGEYHDQILWAILDVEWRQQRRPGSQGVDMHRVVSIRRTIGT